MVPRHVGRQPRAGDAAGLPEGLGVPQHRRQEGLPVELVHGRGGVRSDGRRARDGVQQRDLPDALAAPAPAQDMPVLAYIELTGGDGVVGIARLTLADQHGASR